MRRNEENYDSRIDFSRNRDFAGKYRKYERSVAVGAVCAAGAFLLLQSVVGDNAVRLKEQIQQALNRSDIVILTGGLGPTTDDLTKETAAAADGERSGDGYAQPGTRRGVF